MVMSRDSVGISWFTDVFKLSPARAGRRRAWTCPVFGGEAQFESH